jgi:hypothetical protein
MGLHELVRRRSIGFISPSKGQLTLSIASERGEISQLPAVSREGSF